MIEFMAGKVAGDATVNKGRDGPHPAPEADVLLELGVGFDTVVDTWGTQAASEREDERQRHHCTNPWGAIHVPIVLLSATPSRCQAAFSSSSLAVSRFAIKVPPTWCMQPSGTRRSSAPRLRVRGAARS